MIRITAIHPLAASSLLRLDEGYYDLYIVNANTNAVDAWIYLASWPGYTNQYYEGTVPADSILWVGELEGKKNLNMQVLKASQKKNYFLNLTATFDPPDNGYVLNLITNFVYASFSFRYDNLTWFTLNFQNNMKITKKLTNLELRAGKTKAKINCLKGRIKLQGTVKQMLQSVDDVEFFLRVNDYSAINKIWFNKKRKYNYLADQILKSAKKEPFAFQGQ